MIIQDIRPFLDLHIEIFGEEIDPELKEDIMRSKVIPKEKNKDE